MQLPPPKRYTVNPTNSIHFPMKDASNHSECMTAEKNNFIGDEAKSPSVEHAVGPERTLIGNVHMITKTTVELEPGPPGL